jgi:hypothetical protein
MQEYYTKQYDMEFNAEYDVFMKRKQFYEANTTKAYALLWEQCAKSMHGKVKANEKFESTINGNPIELLTLIQQNCLNYQEHRYEMSIILDSMKTLLSVNHKEHESLQDYTKRFKTAHDEMKSHIRGPIILHHQWNSGGNNKSNSKPLKKTLSDYINYLGSAKQAVDYDTTSDFIINHIVKTSTLSNNIGVAMSTKKPYNMDQHRPSLLPADPEL